MDIYALGATLYNMLTKTPVNSKKLIELMNATTSNPGSGRTAGDLKSAWNSFNPDFDRIAKLAPAVPVLRKMLGQGPPEKTVCRDRGHDAPRPRRQVAILERRALQTHTNGLDIVLSRNGTIPLES